LRGWKGIRRREHGRRSGRLVGIVEIAKIQKAAYLVDNILAEFLTIGGVGIVRMILENRRLRV
jgi:hypothetical protein